MKRFFIAGIILVIIIIGWFLLKTSPVSEPIESDASIMSHIIGTEINVPGVDQKTRIESATGQLNSLPQGTFQIGDNARGIVAMLVDTMGSVTTEEGTDVFIPLTITEGDSGTRVYLGYFFFDGKNLIHRDSTFIGDRVAVQGLEVNRENNQTYVTVNYLDYDLSQSYDESPRVEKQVEVTVENGKLVDLLL